MSEQAKFTPAEDAFVCIPREMFEEWEELAEKSSKAYRNKDFTQHRNLRDRLGRRVAQYIRKHQD